MEQHSWPSDLQRPQPGAAHHLHQQQQQNNTIIDEMEYSHLNTAELVVYNKEIVSRFCARCELVIKDRHFLSALDRDWHTHCLVCNACGVPLDSQGTCYTKDGQIFCKTDYFSRYGWKRCARCSEAISATELVMRVQKFVYHLNCFACTDCDERLSPGEQFALVDTFIYCRLHYERLLINNAASAARVSSILSGSMAPEHRLSTNCLEKSTVHREYSTQQDHRKSSSASTFYRDDVIATTTTATTTAASRNGRATKKRKSPTLEAVTSSNGIVGDYRDRLCVGEGGAFELVTRNSAAVRQKRMRTSFKHNELRIMKSYFALNHNPDAKDLKQLSAKTGLSKRVLQVWFQNARAKYRRNAQKEQVVTSLADDSVMSRENCRNNTMDMTSQQVETIHGGPRPLAVNGTTVTSSNALASRPEHDMAYFRAPRSPSYTLVGSSDRHGLGFAHGGPSNTIT